MAEAKRKHSERLEAIRWLIYAVIAFGVLMLIVVVSALLLTGWGENLLRDAGRHSPRQSRQDRTGRLAKQVDAAKRARQ